MEEQIWIIGDYMGNKLAEVTYADFSNWWQGLTPAKRSALEADSEALKCAWAEELGNWVALAERASEMFSVAMRNYQPSPVISS